MARAAYEEQDDEHETFGIYNGRNSISSTSGDDHDEGAGIEAIDFFDRRHGEREQQQCSSPATDTSPTGFEDEVVSELPPEEEEDEAGLLSRGSVGSSSTSRLQQRKRSPYTPTRSLPRRGGDQPSPFRNPSSVRAMQMNMTPPLSPSRSSSSNTAAGGRRHQYHQQQQRVSNMSASRQSTPRSQQQRLSTKKKVAEREHPLVLLHVTLLPIVLPCSMAMMQTILPGHIIENYNVLRDRVNETMFERGILLAHPREDYELLEERLLESLELKVPRILKCGHFYHPHHHHYHDGADFQEEGGAVKHDDDGDDDETEREDCDVEGEICPDCNRRVHSKLGKGVGTGLRRWTIKIFAANGLMRAGAWQAAWKEMERVDVEIEPWIPEELRRELELMKKEEEEQDHHQMQMDAEKMETLYDGPSGVEHTQEEAEEFVTKHTTTATTAPWMMDHQPQQTQDVVVLPLSTLLRNYLLVLAKDKRNIAIVFLSLLVVALAINNTSNEKKMRSPSITDIIIPECHPHHHHQQQQQQQQQYDSQIPQQNHLSPAAAAAADTPLAVAAAISAPPPASASGIPQPEAVEVIQVNEKGAEKEEEEEEGETGLVLSVDEIA